MSRRFIAAKRVAGFAAILALAGMLLARSGFDLAASRAVLARSGAAIAWLALPFALVVALDAVAWALTLAIPLGARRSLRLASARVALESLALTIPGSALASDGFAPTLIGRFARTDVATAVSGVAVKKWGFVVGHVVLLFLATLVGGDYFERLGEQLDFDVTPRTALVISAFVGAIAVAAFGVALRGGLAESVRRAAMRIPSRFVRLRAERLTSSVARTDEVARRFFDGSRRRIAALVVVSTAVWIAEAVEVYVMLRVLGVSPTMVDVLAMEALLTVIRGVSFFSPGGLGVQEVAYMSFVPALVPGAGVALAGGLVVLRRVRDLVCIAIGYVLVAAALGASTKMTYDDGRAQSERGSRGNVAVGLG